MMDEKPRSIDDLSAASDELLARKLEYAREHHQRCVLARAPISAAMYLRTLQAIRSEQAARVEVNR